MSRVGDVFHPSMCRLVYRVASAKAITTKLTLTVMDAVPQESRDIRSPFLMEVMEAFKLEEILAALNFRV